MNTNSPAELEFEAEPSLTEPVDTSALLEVISAFAGFLDAGEAERAAALWDVPALILGDSHVHGPLSLERVASWLRHSTTGDAADAAASPVPARDARDAPGAPWIRNVQWVSARVASVETCWPRRPHGGLLAGVDGTTFLLRVDQFGQAKIRGLLLHSSSQRASETVPGR